MLTEQQGNLFVFIMHHFLRDIHAAKQDVVNIMIVLLPITTLVLTSVCVLGVCKRIMQKNCQCSCVLKSTLKQHPKFNR